MEEHVRGTSFQVSCSSCLSVSYQRIGLKLICSRDAEQVRLEYRPVLTDSTLVQEYISATFKKLGWHEETVCISFIARR